MAKMAEGFNLDPGNLFDNRQVKLFDSMHRLSGLTVFNDIKESQLVVVGAQGSGKSSVLEALARFHFFPVDDAKPTTRFPIKLVLRTANTEVTHVRIEPAESRPNEQKRSLRSFAESLSDDNDFRHIMEKAKADLGVFPSRTIGESNGNKQIFCGDVLVIERHGPSMPKLSLVDLPGLFGAGNSEQTLDDRDSIETMVSKYIGSSRNIILIVISAEVNDYCNQPALGLVQRMQKDDTTLKKRAICVLTRPDTAGSLPETLKVLGKDNTFSGSFARPWHVVRNQDQNARKSHQSPEDRDKVEVDFFSQPDWEGVAPDQKGIAMLRETLKSMIWSHTQDQLPGIISEVKAKIKEAEARLNSATYARATPEARRKYLSYVAGKFSILTWEAVKGTYENEGCQKDHQTGEACQDCDGFFDCFGNNSGENQQKRLRSNIRALNRAFAAAMRQYGRTEVELDTGKATTPANRSLGPMPQQHVDAEIHFQPQGTTTYYIHEKPKCQGRREYENFVRGNMNRWESKGPGGEPSDGAFSGLLAYQAQKWGKIASQHIQAVWLVVEEFIRLALVASCPDRDVLRELQRRLVDPNLEKLKVEANRSLRDLISCHIQSNPGFYDSFVEDRAVRKHAESLLQRLAAMRPAPGEGTEAVGTSNEPIVVSTTSSAEQVNGQQSNAEQTSSPRHPDPKPKTQQANSTRGGEQKAKDRSQKSREAILTYTLDNITAIMGSGYPFLSNTLVRKAVIPMIAQQISLAFESNSDSSSKEKAKSTETNIRKTVRELYPSNFGDLAAARVIEQVETHYEVRILATNYLHMSIVPDQGGVLLFVTVILTVL